MNEISQQVTRAQRRLNVGKFFRIFCWAVFAGLFIATIGLAIPKVWHLPFLETTQNQSTWIWSWVGGGCALGFVIATVMTWLSRDSKMVAAVEVDRRFGLKERISSAMSLQAKEVDTEAGQALINDASEKAQTIDIRDKFNFQPKLAAALPLIPAMVLFALMFVPNAALDKTAQAKEAEKLNKEKVKVAVEEARKKLEKKAKETTTPGLKDALAKLDSLDKKLDSLGKDSTEDKKESLVKLNDIKKQIEDRQKQLGGANELKKSLKKLADIGDSPAKQLAEAMKSGDLKEAEKAIRDLAEKLKNGKLTNTEKKALAKDLQKIADQLDKMAQEHEKEKQELKEKIKQAQKQGDMDKAAQLQQQLEKKQQQDQQAEKMKKMANNLKKCADCMKQGQQNEGGKKNGKGQQPSKGGNQQAQAQMKKAGNELEDLADDLQDMMDELDELDDLEDFSDELDKIKDALNDCECEGNGDEPQWKDWGKGKGPGGGKREKGEGETGGYKSRVKAKLKKGQTVVTGNADGDNISGRSVSEAREIVATSMSQSSDPLENQKLPKSQREHAKEYFQKLRGN